MDASDGDHVQQEADDVGIGSALDRTARLHRRRCGRWWARTDDAGDRRARWATLWTEGARIGQGGAGGRRRASVEGKARGR